jgi:hypothetical protein
MGILFFLFSQEEVEHKSGTANCFIDQIHLFFSRENTKRKSLFHKRELTSLYKNICSHYITMREVLAIANRHSSPPYRWAKALLTIEEGVFCREMINSCARTNSAASS